jgi:hypothetical protein
VLPEKEHLQISVFRGFTNILDRKSVYFCSLRSLSIFFILFSLFSLKFLNKNQRQRYLIFHKATSCRRQNLGHLIGTERSCFPVRDCKQHSIKLYVIKNNNLFVPFIESLNVISTFKFYNSMKILKSGNIERISIFLNVQGIIY